MSGYFKFKCSKNWRRSSECFHRGEASCPGFESNYSNISKCIYYQEEYVEYNMS